MPSDTFFRLPEEKRQKILQVIGNEFALYPFESVSINRIIHQADISRGSFYQYFNDKQDVFTYLIRECSQSVFRYAEKLLHETRGDPFAFSLILFDSVTQTVTHGRSNCDLYRNLIGNLKMQDREFLSAFFDTGSEYCQKLKQIVDTKCLKSEKTEELDCALDIIHSVLHKSICEALRGDSDIRAVRNRLEYKLEMLKSGLVKNKEEEC